jgi:hypothetical protein
LLTSQDSDWVAQETINLPISLRSLDTDDGVKLLDGIFSRWKRIISREAAERIVYETGGLPLALRQIGSYICTIGTDPEDFVDRYSNVQGSNWVDQWSGSTQPSYPRTLATFLDFSLSKLHQQALSALGVFCFLDVDNVWAEILNGSSSGQLFHAESSEYVYLHHWDLAGTWSCWFCLLTEGLPCQTGTTKMCVPCAADL